MVIGATLAVVGLLANAREPGGTAPVVFEDAARAIVEGRSPSFVARRQHGLLMTFTQPSKNGTGADLYFQTSGDLGDTFSERMRVNNVPGEVSDHGENSPQLLASAGERDLYAVWNARDPKSPGGSIIRFSRSDGMRVSWSPAVTVNDDNQQVSHSFQGAAVAPDGTIYVAWLDGRERAGSGHEATHVAGLPGTSALFLATSFDRGQTFQKNVRVAGNVCPCCLPSIGFLRGRVTIAWRGVEAGDVRDVHASVSDDRGATWTPPALVARDGWKLNGCPHVGPSIASFGDAMYVTWFSEGGEQPAIYLARSDDGRRFSAKERISGTVLDPTHPFAFGAAARCAIVLQAREEQGQQGWGRFVVYYREVHQNGTMADLVRVSRGEANVNYPTLAFGTAGRVFIGWSERRGDTWQVLMARGRSADGVPQTNNR